MSVGFRIVRDVTRAARPLIQAFAEIPTPLISDNMNRMFAGGAGLRPIHTRGTMCGPALTVHTRPGDNLMIHKAIDMAEKGDVIVVEAGGDVTSALIGEIMVRIAEKKGVAGFVIDGAVRDAGALARNIIPVYARGVTHRGPYKDGPGEINVAIAIDGMVIQPGDIVAGDEDGVVRVPKDEATKVLDLARAQLQAEAKTMKAIAEGTLDRNWVDQRLAERGCKILMRARHAPEALRRFGERCFAAAGMTPDGAATVADVLVHAEERGHASHGITRVPITVKRLRAGVMKPRPEVKLHQVAPGMALIDGDNGPGPIASVRALDAAVAMAKTQGVGVGVVAHSNHNGAGSYYAERAMVQGCIALCATNAPPSMAVHGGRSAVVGTQTRLTMGVPGGAASWP